MHSDSSSCSVSLALEIVARYGVSELVSFPFRLRTYQHPGYGELLIMPADGR